MSSEPFFTHMSDGKRDLPPWLKKNRNGPQDYTLKTQEGTILMDVMIIVPVTTFKIIAYKVEILMKINANVDNFQIAANTIISDLKSLRPPRTAPFHQKNILQ